LDVPTHVAPTVPHLRDLTFFTARKADSVSDFDGGVLPSPRVGSQLVHISFRINSDPIPRPLLAIEVKLAPAGMNLNARKSVEALFRRWRRVACVTDKKPATEDNLRNGISVKVEDGRVSGSVGQADLRIALLERSELCQRSCGCG
jgi:hypothetical protein